MSLSPDDQQAILALPFIRRTFGKEEYMVREGQRSEHCSLMLRGLSFRQKLIGDGGRQIVSFQAPTEFVDLQNGLLGVADHNVQSLDGSEAAVIARSALLELSRDRPAVRLAMLIDTLIEASISREWVVNVGRRDARARISHLLCELACRLENIGERRDGHFDFPLTQEQLADATGLTPVHTNRTLQSLRREGLIKLGSRTLAVLDWERLKDAAGFDDLYLHQQSPLVPLEP